MDEKQLEILADAIMRYGQEAQLDMCIEECSELTKAICKYKRNKCMDTVDAIIDETADVIIMATQAAMIFGLSRVKDRIKFKVERLNRRLEGNHE